MRIGYARVSTIEQNLDLQEDALKAAGCEKVYTDKTGGTRAERPGLERALADLRPGDKLVVWKLGALAEFERDINRERTLAGLAAARAGGRSRGHLPDAGDLEGDALSVSGRTEEPMIDDPIGQEARRVSEPSATVGCPANWTTYGWFLLRCYLTPELPDHWSGPADRPRLHDLTHPLSFPAGAAFGTIAATGPASLADTRRAYQQSMQL